MEQSLSRDELIALKNRRTAVTVFQVSWIMVFVCLSLVNFQIRSNFPTWPPEGVAALDRVLPTLATVALLVSGVMARAGVSAVASGQIGAFMTPWRLAIGLGAAFALVMAFQWATVQISGQYSAIFRVMVGYHALHAIVIGWMMIRVYQSAQRGDYDDAHPMKTWLVEASARLWYFVIVAWVLFYAVLYVV
jgi:heme/copper-type cytochrome/quinol oxidase subunit 3